MIGFPNLIRNQGQCASCFQVKLTQRVVFRIRHFGPLLLNSKQHFSNRHEAMNSVSGEPWCGILCGDSLGTVPVGIHPQSPRSDTTRCRDFGIGDGRGWIPEFLLIVSSYSFLTFFWLFALTAIRNPKKKDPHSNQERGSKIRRRLTFHSIEWLIRYFSVSKAPWLSQPGCQVLQLAGPFLMTKLTYIMQMCSTILFCVIKLSRTSLVRQSNTRSLLPVWF